MRRALKFIIPVCVIGASCAPVLATSPSSIPPLRGIKSVEVDILVGGGLDLEAASAIELFGGDPDRSREFKSMIRELARKELEEAGFEALVPNEVEDLAATGVGVIGASFFGRPVILSATEGPVYVYLVVLQAAQVPPIASDDPYYVEWSRQAIGVSSEVELAEQLQAAFLALLEDLLADVG